MEPERASEAFGGVAMSKDEAAASGQTGGHKKTCQINLGYNTEPQPRQAIFQSASRYMNQGIHVFPVGKSKIPMAEKWNDRYFGLPDFENAEGIGSCPGLWPEPVIAFDVDRTMGRKSWDILIDKYGPLPPTYSVSTGRTDGGEHFYFKVPTGDLYVKSPSSKISHKVDIRGTRGQAVLPPTVHKSGRQYRWKYDGQAVEFVDISKIPALPDRWVQALIETDCAYHLKEKKVQKKIRNTSSSTPYGLKALEEETGKVRSAPEGQRNDTLNRAAFAMGQLVAGGELSQSLVESVLMDAGLATGLDEREVSKTLKSGLEKGMQEPRKASVTIPEKQNNDLRGEIAAMLKMDAIDREVARKEIAEKHGVRKSVIDQFIKSLEEEKNGEGTTEIVISVEPWETEVDGLDVLSKIKSLLHNHIILPHSTAEAISEWVLLTYCFDAFRILPILGVVSPEKRCGKTSLLEVLQGLCNKALLASNVSPSAVFRTIEKYQPTLLIDEADSFLKDNEELRGVLNSGHTRVAAFVIRVQGDNHEPVRFSTWAPKAVAMIGDLPGTLQDRSVMVKLRRKAPGEKVAKLDIDFAKRCSEIRRKCQRWSDDNMDMLRTVSPKVPDTGNDRQADNWYPLFCIAEVVGGEWPELIKNSMVGSTDTDDGTISIKLLSDIRDILKDHPGDRIFSDNLVDKLKSMCPFGRVA